MNGKLYTVLAMVMIVMFPLVAFSDAEEKLEASYYDQLKSLLSRKTLSVRPKESERDVNLIEVEKGAAGVLFGASMDDVVAVWGKPCGLMVGRGINDVWDLHIGASRFGFFDNELVAIDIHSAMLENAQMDNGINFESSYDEVMAAFGDPIEASEYNPEFETENGYVVTFHFMPDESPKDKRLIAIGIYHPDSGR